jgi:hypothetical protein
MTQQQLDAMFGLPSTMTDERRRELHNQGFDAGYSADWSNPHAEAYCPAWLEGEEKSTWLFGFDHGFAAYQADRV